MKRGWNLKVWVHAYIHTYVLALLTATHATGKELVAFGAMVRQMLEDVQQRLTFKAQVRMHVRMTIKFTVPMCTRLQVSLFPISRSAWVYYYSSPHVHYITLTYGFSQLYIQHDIRGYTPVSGDLAYPEKLLVTAGITRDKEKSQSDSDSVFDPSGTEVYR